MQFNLDKNRHPSGGIPERAPHARMRRQEEIDRMPGQEVVEKRTAVGKFFSLGDNLHQAVLYGAPVHYKDKVTGEWKEIDNSLEEEKTPSGGKRLRNRENGMFQVRLSAEEKEPLVSLENENGAKLSWVLEGAQRRVPGRAKRDKKDFGAMRGKEVLERNEDGAVFAEILPDTDISCTVRGASFKDDIVFKSKEAAKPVSFLLSAPGLRLERKEGNAIEVVDVEGNAQFILPPPIMADAKGAIGDVHLELEEKKDGAWRLTYVPDREWTEKAEFPVTLDPAVYCSTILSRRMIDSAAPNAVGSFSYYATNVAGRKRITLVASPGADTFSGALPAIDASLYVTKATYTMPYNHYTNTANAPIHVREITSPWSVNAVTYNTCPTFGQDIDVCEAPTQYGGAFTFDITPLVRKWYNGSPFGFAMEARRDGADMFLSYYSPASPYMVITYMSAAGLESYYSYESHSAGRAGTAHVNLFNGNLVFEHVDSATSGSRMPVSVSHYYNSCYRDQDYFLCGYGWKTSMQMVVYKEECQDAYGNTQTSYVFVDGDGTKHYFLKDNTNYWYVDTSGLSLQLTVNEDTGLGYITDKYGNRTTIHYCKTLQALSTLNIHYLVKNYQNVHSDYLQISAVSTNLDGVSLSGSAFIDGAGRKTSYYRNGYTGPITRICAPGYETTGVRFAYDASLRMTKITHEDGAETLYGYDSRNLLTSVTNHDGRKLTIEYYETAPYRVKKITESNGAVIGNCREYTYDEGAATVTDRTVENGKKLTYQFNNYGNAVGISDMLGHAAVAKFSDTSIRNHPDAVSKMMRSVVNLLKNHAFEKPTGWTLSGLASYAANNAYTGSRCLCFDNRRTGGVQQASQEISLTPGKAYTLSFYVKCCGQMDIRAAVQYLDASGAEQTLQSPSLVKEPMFEYDRVHWTFTVPEGAASSTVTVCLQGIADATDISRVWIDCAQLEEGTIANRYSMLLNGGFTHNDGATPMDWVPAEGNDASDIATESANPNKKPDGLGAAVMRIAGDSDKAKGLYQDIPLSGESGDVFVAGGWAKAFSRSRREEESHFGLRVQFKNKLGVYVDAKPVVWADQWNQWQFTCGPLLAPENYTAIRFWLDYQKNVNVAEFDGLFLYRDQFGQSFTYDDKGNVLSVKNLTGYQSGAVYDRCNNVTSYREPGHPESDKHTMVYGTPMYGTPDVGAEKHLLLKSTNPAGIVRDFTYDGKGNRLTAQTTGPNTTEFIKSTATYTSDMNYPLTQVDARGKTITQDINTTTGVLNSVTDPKGQTVSYDYDTLRRVTFATATADGKTYRNAYTYTQDKLTEVKHNTDSDTACDVAYTFAYDALGNQTEVKVGSQVLSTNIYTETGDKLLKAVEYGNGGKVRYAHDEYKRVTGMAIDDEEDCRYTYAYDASGFTAQVQDHHLGRTLSTEYDLSNRPARQREKAGDEHIYTSEVAYDMCSRVVKVKEQVGKTFEPYETYFEYDNINRPTVAEFESSEKGMTLKYDGIGRLTTRKLTAGTEGYTTTYGFAAGGHGTNSATGLVTSITQPGQDFSYTYDDVGNIISETRNGVTTGYVYDKLGQLIRVNDPVQDKTVQYTYDRGGNILTKTEHAYTTETPGAAIATVNCTYGDASWKDKLTAYNGTTISYDAIGNPLSDGEWTYTWKAGRQLQSVSKNGEVVSFAYNASGLRVSKTSLTRGTTHYTLSGKRIAHLTRGTVDMHFFYGADGKPAMVRYNESDYYYVYNVQGDVVALVDRLNGCEQVVEYAYDAWGKQVRCTGSMADTLGKENPFRYRGYVYDEETGLYYLRSRYYNPTWGRFLNADTVLTRNLFEYCVNNPTMRIDPEGKTPRAVLNLLMKEDIAAGSKPTTNGNSSSPKAVQASAVHLPDGGTLPGGYVTINIMYSQFVKEITFVPPSRVNEASRVDMSMDNGLTQLESILFGVLAGSMAPSSKHTSALTGGGLTIVELVEFFSDQARSTTLSNTVNDAIKNGTGLVIFNESVVDMQGLREVPRVLPWVGEFGEWPDAIVPYKPF